MDDHGDAKKLQFVVLSEKDSVLKFVQSRCSRKQAVRSEVLKYPELLIVQCLEHSHRMTSTKKLTLDG